MLIRHAAPRLRPLGGPVLRVRRDHRLAAELRACIVLGGDFGLGLDIVTGAVFSATNSPTIEITEEGPATGFSGTAYISAPSDPSWNVTGEIAVAWRGRSTNVSSGGLLLGKVSTVNGNGGSDTPFSLDNANPTGGRITFVRSNTTYRVWQSDSVGLADNILASVVATQGADISVMPTIYVDGVPSSATSQYSGAGTGAATGNADPLNFGRRPDGALQHNGATHIALIAARTWDDGDGSLFHVEPYGVLEEASRFYFAPVASSAVDLTAASIASASSVGTPALGQIHALGATGIASAASVGTPALAQSHALVAASVASAPIVGAPAVGQVHALAAPSVAAAASVGTPALAQAHGLAAAGIASTATVGTPALGQVHALAAPGAVAASSVGAPALGQVHALAASSIAAASSVGTPGLNAMAVPVPASRTYTVPAAPRRHSVAVAPRRYALPAAARRYTVQPEG